MPYPLGLITLLTDFGDRDYFVASMKGVILTINPHATIVDLSHQIAPHKIEEAGYVLHSCYRSFPDGTIHVAVVDPGVGSNRRPLLVSSSRYYFLAPDNGLLTYVMKEEDGVEVRHIENKQYRLKAQGATFDGRDLFAPAAAWLAKGEPLASFGRLVNDPVKFPLEEPVWQDQRLVGRIVYVDRFGNLISNILRKHLEEVEAVTKHPTPEIHIAQQTIKGLVVSYSEGEGSRPAALLNSNGFLEIFVKEGSVAEALGLKSGALITVT
jgi:S-adenosylmethionine hydrolase